MSTQRRGTYLAWHVPNLSDVERDRVLTELGREYDTLRSEVVASIAHRLSVLQFGLATIGVVFAGAFTSKNGSIEEISCAYIVPILAVSVFSLWSSEYLRMVRAARHLRLLEYGINRLLPFKVLGWEGHLTRGYVAYSGEPDGKKDGGTTRANKSSDEQASSEEEASSGEKAKPIRNADVAGYRNEVLVAAANKNSRNPPTSFRRLFFLNRLNGPRWTGDSAIDAHLLLGILVFLVTAGLPIVVNSSVKPTKALGDVLYWRFPWVTLIFLGQFAFVFVRKLKAYSEHSRQHLFEMKAYFASQHTFEDTWLDEWYLASTGSASAGKVGAGDDKSTVTQ